MKGIRAGIVGVAVMSSIAMSQAAWAEPITLQLSDQNPATAWGPVHALHPWVQQIEEKTGGQVKITIHAGQSKAKGAENWNAVTLGVVDMGWNMMAYWPGKFPLSEVLTLPGLPIKTAEQGSELAWKLYETFPEIQKEFADVKVLVLFTSAPYRLVTLDREVTSLADIKGMTIRAPGGLAAEQITLLGASPVTLPMPQVAVSLQKGIITGAALAMEAIEGFKIQGIMKYCTEVPFGASLFSVTMNKKRWQGLSPEVQASIMELSGAAGSKSWGHNFHDTPEEAVRTAAGAGVKFSALSAEEREKWMETSAKPLWDKWVSQMEQKGHGKARQVLDTTLELLK